MVFDFFSNKISRGSDVNQYQAKVDAASQEKAELETEKTDKSTHNSIWDLMQDDTVLKPLLFGDLEETELTPDNSIGQAAGDGATDELVEMTLVESTLQSTQEYIRNHILQQALAVGNIPTLGQGNGSINSRIEPDSTKTDKKGRVTQETYTDGDNIYTVEYTYNQNGGIEGATMTSATGGAKTEERTLTFGSLGNLDTEEIDEINEKGQVSKRHSIEYTDIGEIAFYTEYERNSQGKLEAVYIDDCNGQVDYLKQNNKANDCWLLSTLASLSYTPSGRKLTENSITKNEDGSYSVYLKGIDTTIQISNDKLQQAYTSGKYSNGDKDVVLLELAYESAINDIQNGKIEISGNPNALSIKNKAAKGYQGLNLGNMEDAMYLLTGHSVATMMPGPSYEYGVNAALNDLENKPNNYAITVALISKCSDVNGEPLHNTNGHLYAIKKVDGEYVTIVDPENTSKTIVVTRDVILKCSGSVQVYMFREDEKVT